MNSEKRANKEKRVICEPMTMTYKYSEIHQQFEVMNMKEEGGGKMNIKYGRSQKIGTKNEE